MSDTILALPFDLKHAIPKHMRKAVKAGEQPPAYQINRVDYDRLPIDTFLIETTMGTQGRHVKWCLRLVVPNNPRRYPPSLRTPGQRLLYAFWAHGKATRQLYEPKSNVYRHVILPDDPRHEMMAAFKVGCDTKRAMNSEPVEFSATLLYRALGVEPLTPEDEDVIACA